MTSFPSTPQDVLDLRTMSSLEASVVEFSKSSQELKKLCVGLVTAVPTLIVSLTDHKLDAAVFVGELLVATAFWLVDSYTYFYQDKLREVISNLDAGVRDRHGIDKGAGGPVVSLIGRTKENRLRRSLFNPSHAIYGIMAVLAICLWIAYSVRWIS